MHTQWCQFSERTVSNSIISSILPKQIYKRISYHIKPKFFKSYIEAICISIELTVLHFRMKPLLQKAILHARIQLYGCTEDLWEGKLKRKTTVHHGRYIIIYIWKTMGLVPNCAIQMRKDKEQSAKSAKGLYRRSVCYPR